MTAGYAIIWIHRAQPVSTQWEGWFMDTPDYLLSIQYPSVVLDWFQLTRTIEDHRSTWRRRAPGGLGA